MSDIEFLDGIIVKPPCDGAPSFVKGSISIKREELIATLSNKQDEWINLDIKESKAGKWYAAINDWKPNTDQPQKSANQASQNMQSPVDDGFDDDINF